VQNFALLANFANSYLTLVAKMSSTLFCKLTTVKVIISLVQFFAKRWFFALEEKFASKLILSIILFPDLVSIFVLWWLGCQTITDKEQEYPNALLCVT